MPRDLFGDVTRPSISIGNRKWYTVPLSLLSHSAIIFAVIAVPLLATPFLPHPPEQQIVDFFVSDVPAPPPLPKARPIENVEPVTLDVAPTAAPEGFTPEKPRVEAGWEDAQPGPGIVTGVDDLDVIVAPPPPPEVPNPVRVGGAVREPQKIRHVSPAYPTIAQAARVQGVVIIEATIGVDGRLMNARLLRSIPLLDQAALEAVRQWEFTPTLLNGVPVPVIMTVTVNFTLK